LKPLIPPQILVEELPLTPASTTTVLEARREAEAIVRKQDDRLLVIVGPCSIHDPQAALEYGAPPPIHTTRVAAELHRAGVGREADVRDVGVQRCG
jgi:3-deoxy-7-phosphoheptulonate synthase